MRNVVHTQQQDLAMIAHIWARHNRENNDDVDFRSYYYGTIYADNPHYMIRWWDLALSSGHRSYCFAGDDYEDNFLDTAWITINSDVSNYTDENFRSDIRHGNFYTVVSDTPKMGKGPLLKFFIIDNKLFITVSSIGSDNYRAAYVTVKGISKTIGNSPNDLIKNQSMELINDVTSPIYSYYIFDLPTASKYRGIRAEIKLDYLISNKYVTYQVFSQPYYPSTSGIGWTQDIFDGDNKTHYVP